MILDKPFNRVFGNAVDSYAQIGRNLLQHT